MRFEKKHVVSVGRFLGRQVLGNAKVVVFFGKNKKGPNDQSSKGVGCWLLVFGGRGLERNQKIFCRMEWEKKENRIIRAKIYNLENYKSKDNFVNGGLLDPIKFSISTSFPSFFPSWPLEFIGFASLVAAFSVFHKTQPLCCLHPQRLPFVSTNGAYGTSTPRWLWCIDASERS